MFLIIHKDWRNIVDCGRVGLAHSARLMILVLLLASNEAPRAAAQNTAPAGRFVQAGPTFGGGVGAILGVVDARTVYIREVHLLSDLEPVLRKSKEQARVAVVVGISIRVFGFERLIGGVGYRGFDVDIGLRVGPGLSFSTRDTRIERNRRFVLLAEPTLRISRAIGIGRALLVEAGTARPSVRIGVWQKF